MKLKVIETIRGDNINNLIGSWQKFPPKKIDFSLLELVGKKIIIFGVIATNTKEPTLIVYTYYPYSVENREIVLEKMVSRSFENTLSLIFNFIIIISFIKFLSYIFYRWTYKKFAIFKILPYLIPLELLLYGYYEIIMPPEYNIRIDLLLIFPALLCSIIFSFLLVLKQSKKELVKKN